MKKLIKLLFLTTFLLSQTCIVFALEGIKINFIDVGYGDAIIIQSKDNAAIIDTGGLLTGHKLVDFLKEENIKNIKFLIISHPDLDHMGGVFFIFPEFKIEEIFDNGQIINRGNDAQRWYAQLVRSRNNYRVLKAGDNLKMGEVNLRVVWPDAPKPQATFNENSLVLQLKYHDFKCLFAADLTASAEKQLLGKGLDLKSSVLKVGHHGYLDAGSDEFLGAVAAHYAIISTGERETRGTPSEEVIARLKQKGMIIYRTDLNGRITLKVNKNADIEIKTQR